MTGSGVHETFAKKCDALRRCKETGLLGIAQDYGTGSGAKDFHLFDAAGLVSYVKRTPENRLWLHEIICDDRCTKLVIDIECEDTHNRDMDFPGSLCKLVEYLVKFYEIVHHINGVDESDFAYLYATREGKYSAHIVQFRGVVFENTKTLYAFLSQFEYWIIHEEIMDLGLSSHQRCSVLARTTPRLVSLPSSSISFTSEEEEEEEGEPVYFSSFRSIIDMQPITSTDGMLRTYFSTKPGGSEDCRLRLATISVTSEETRVVLAQEIDYLRIISFLSQAIQPTVAGEDRTTKVVYSPHGLVNWEVYSQRIDRKIALYTYNYMRLWGTTMGQNHRLKFITMADLKKSSTCTIREVIVDIINHLTKSARRPGVLSICSESPNGDVFKCNIQLRRSKYVNLYRVCNDILREYVNRGKRSLPVPYKDVSHVSLVKIKINSQTTCLCLVTKGLPCEIVYNEVKRNHETSSSSATWLKILINDGVIKQMCHKEFCYKKSAKHMLTMDDVEDLHDVLWSDKRLSNMRDGMGDQMVM